MTMAEPRVQAEARLRPKNQITLPEPIVLALEAKTNDIVVFEVDPEDPRSVHLRLIPRAFAGSLTGVFGTTEETLAFVRGERESWGG